MVRYTKNFDRSVRGRVLATFGTITTLILGSWCVIGFDSTLAVSSSPSSSTNLPSVKITTLHNGQQVPVGSNVVISGISSPPPADKKRTDCTVSVLVNALKPYKKAVATGRGETTDYSTWRYSITPNDAAIKQGQNKITAKISCAATPTNLMKYNSVNVTGISAPNSVNGQNGKNGTNGANGISSGGNVGSAVGGIGGNAGRGGNGGNANGGNGGSANGGNGGSAVGGNGGSAVGGNGGAGGNGGNGGNANGRNG